MGDDLVKRLRASNAYKAPDFAIPFVEPIKAEAADRIEALEAEIKLHEECATIIHFQGVRYAHENMADAIWAEFKDKWEGEKKYALRQIVKWLKKYPRR
jgi:hypothetical protein